MRVHRALCTTLLLAAASACHDDGVAPDPGTSTDDPTFTAPDAALLAAGATITASDVAHRIGILAADSMKGRYTGRPELEMAASYLAAALGDVGVEPAGTDGFYQRWTYTGWVRDSATVVLELADSTGPSLEAGRDYVMVAGVTGRDNAVGDVLWGGAAETSPDAGGLSMKDRVVLYDLPIDRLDLSTMTPLGDVDYQTYSGGAAAYGFVVSDSFSETRMAETESFTRLWSRAAPMFFIRESAADALLAAAGEADVAELRAGAPRTVSATVHARAAHVQTMASPPNVVGMLRGSDPALRDEYVVVSAHFDHVGTGIPDATGDSIANGADDNASGTSAVLEVAEALASLETPPARSVLFLLVSGEEEGLLGSTAFVNAPTVPLSDVVADVNLDMVGRNDPGEIIGVGREYTSLGARATFLAGAVGDLGLQVVPDPAPDEHLFFRSDQLSFVCHDVPAIFFTSGLHADYHRPSDEPAKEDDDKVARVARLSLFLVHGAANAADRPTWTASGDTARGQISNCR